MKKVYRYDRKHKTLILQSTIMLLIAFGCFYAYSTSFKTIYLVLFAFAMALIGIYFYRIFFMRVAFEDDKITFKGISKRHTLIKSDLFDIQIVRQIGKNITITQFSENINDSILNDKCYIFIRKDSNKLLNNLSMFNAASDNHICLEYRPDLKKELIDILKIIERQ